LPASAKRRLRRSRWRSAASAKVSPPPGSDLDLGVDQLPANGGRELVVGLGGLVQLLEAVLELERLGVEDRELLLDPDREVRGGLEGLVDAVEVEPGVRRLGVG